MRMVINHLTRMQRGFICVAGVDLATRRHVRPVLRRQMRAEMLACHGGPFDIGAVVDLGPVRSQPQRPEVEDCLFQEDRVRVEGRQLVADFWQLQTELSRKRLISIFGASLQIWRGKCVMPVRHGNASLGCLRPGQARLLLRHFDGRASIKMRLVSGHREFHVPVTDIRLYESDHVTPSESLVSRVNEHLRQRNVAVLLSVGLSRRFKKAANDPAFHFLQVNNIHFEDCPLWQLGHGSHAHDDAVHS